jgi:predicted transcriptional regulators
MRKEAANMNQKKIGSFLKELRKEKGITQEEFAENLNVSGRTVSRWETGVNMPDISLLVDIAEFFNVSIPEIINGERKSEIMEKEVKEVAEAMSNYAAAEKSVILKRVKLISIIGLISLVIGLVMEAINYDSMIPIYECMKETCLGFGVGALATMVLYTTGILEKIKNRKSKQMKIVAIFCSGIIAICIIVSLILTII